MMKTKMQAVTMIMVLLLLLTGCQAKQATQLTGTEESTIATVPSLSKMLYGVLSLEGTENVLTSDQYRTMLFLWKGVKSLNGSDNAATDEVTGLTEQIYNTFNDGQKQYITSLDLTPETTQNLSANLSIDQTAADTTDITISGGMGGGPMGGGGMPSGGQRPSGGGGDMMGAVMSGMEVPGQTGSTGNQTAAFEVPLSENVIDAFIVFLKDKTPAK